MKVVLRQDVEHLGERGQIVNVSPGFARNYLLPKMLAMEATPGNLRNFELQKRVWVARESREVEEARSFAGRLESVRIAVSKKAGEHDVLYGSVTSSEIADLLAAKGIEVDRRKIQLDEPIKSLGTFEVPVKIHRQVTAKVTVQVVAEAE
ncbi:MAG: 50S ribosomal protein L9 [Acidobacteriia bacterium]|nr:50S ribosomal protein L9 [Terriglobia bacterium]